MLQRAKHTHKARFKRLPVVLPLVQLEASLTSEAEAEHFRSVDSKPGDICISSFDQRNRIVKVGNNDSARKGLDCATSSRKLVQGRSFSTKCTDTETAETCR